MVSSDPSDGANGREMDGVPLTTREFVGGSGAMAAGGLAGCLEGDTRPPATTTAKRTATTDEAPAQRETAWTDDVDAGGNALTNLGQLNDAVYVGDDETLNEAVERADGETIHVVLPEGVTEFEATIEDADFDLAIEGQGKDATTLRASGADALYGQHDVAADRTLSLSGFTLDLDNQAGGRLIYADEEVDFGRLLVEDVRVVNVDNESQADMVGLFTFDGTTDLVRIDDSSFRFDTFTNRSGHKYLIYFESGVPGVTRRFLARRNYHVGERIDISEARPERDVYNGYVVNPTEFALVEGCDFRKWDQYATFLQGREGATIKVVNNHCAQVGHGDMLRAGASGLTEDVGVRLLVHGNTIRGPAEASGDRGIMIQHGNEGLLESAVITNNTIQDVLVPIGVTSGRNVLIANNTIVDSGHPDYGGSSRPAIVFRNRRAASEDVRIAGNVITNLTESREQGPAVWVRDEGQGWSGFLIVEHNAVRGINTDPEEYGTDDEFLLEPAESDDLAVVERDNVIV